MMPKRIPIIAAKRILQEFGLRQVILFAFDGELTHCVTYGKSGDDAVQASDGAKKIMQGWGWPEDFKEPSRFRTVLAENKLLKAELERFSIPIPTVRT